MSAKARFEVSTEGMAGLHEGRDLWSLVKELVANVWDEDSTICHVEINPIFSPERVERLEVKVEDDGPGFKDINDAFTLMAPTNKRHDSSVRGRFNIGEKEILSIAVEGKVETVGQTVYFPENGGREIEANDRKKGTIVSAIVNRPHSELEGTVDALLGFLPPKNIDYVVNGQKVENRVHVATTTGRRLHTILASGIGEPLKYSYRNAQIDIYEPQNGVGHIFEMGIAIQEIEMPYDVDIQQKVPMPPNRDTVTAKYLQSVFAEVLKVTVDDLKEEHASESWVQMAVEDARTEDDVVKKVMDAKLGENVVLWSKDTYANEMAHDNGFEVVQPRTLSKIERSRFKDVGLQTSHAAYGLKTDENAEIKIYSDDEITESMRDVEAYTKWLSKQLLGFECHVRFIGSLGLGDDRVAQYGGRQLDYVVPRLGEDWFEMPNGKPLMQHTEMIIHELGHEGKSITPHTGEYVHRLAELGAKATHLATSIVWWSVGVRV